MKNYARQLEESPHRKLLRLIPRHATEADMKSWTVPDYGVVEINLSFRHFAHSFVSSHWLASGR